jgi:Flp pilus assembly protein TadG
MSPTCRNDRNTRNEAGTSAVEMALILPVLLLMLFGIIDLANMLRIQITLDSAASNVAREVALDPLVRTQTSATSYMNDNNLLPGVKQNDPRASEPVLTLSPQNPTCTSSSCTPFEVGITYTYYAITQLTQPFFDGIVLSASVRKTAEPGT